MTDGDEKYPHQALTREIAIASAHQAQLLNYLKATGKKVGLLLNFGAKRVDVKRMVF